MSRSAKISPSDLVHVLERLPEYRDYDEGERAQELESSYRVGVGRMVKSWGDQLLDIAEHSPRALSRNHAALIDNLLEEIGEIFRVLNTMGTLDPFENEKQAESTRRCDSRLLESLDEAQRLVSRLQQREFSGVWIEQNAKPLIRQLQHIERLLSRRNKLLGIPTTPEAMGMHEQDYL